MIIIIISRQKNGNEGDGYMSSQKSYELGRIRQYKDLCGKDDDHDDGDNNNGGDS